MANMVNYIQQQLADGYSKEQIRKNLFNQGYKDAQISEWFARTMDVESPSIISHYEKQDHTIASSSSDDFTLVGNKSIFICSALIVIFPLAGIIASIYFLARSKSQREKNILKIILIINIVIVVLSLFIFFSPLLWSLF